MKILYFRRMFVHFNHWNGQVAVLLAPGTDSSCKSALGLTVRVLSYHMIDSS